MSSGHGNHGSAVMNAFLLASPLCSSAKNLSVRFPSSEARTSRRQVTSASQDDLIIRRARPNSKPSESTVSDIRRKQAAVSAAAAARAQRRIDEDERIRLQIATEKLSAEDLFGIVSPHDNTHSTTVASGQNVSAPQRNSDVRDTTAPATLQKPARKRTRVPANQVQQQPFQTASSLRPGDVVSHVRHGYGRFRGLERTLETSPNGAISRERICKEYAVIEYRDGDVYVPLAHLDLLTRVDPRKEPVKLDILAVSASGLGASSIARRQSKSRYKTRLRTRAKIREQLEHLSALYASRKSLVREPFKIDELTEKHFADTCEFELTYDQHQALRDVLSDLSETNMPMDRLLCGDVGFGKTEVAMRAAFRVLNAGRQVAVLSPSTILARQHHETFAERFQKVLPEIRISLMTRFSKRKTMLSDREALANGECSVVIGTHALLGDAVSFKNLGLLIVDEEHRFGVHQKEKLRIKHRGIDSLFLSATPIPRTLHLALSGLKDTSVIRTPPPGRKAVITKVVPSGAGVIRNAIRRETERGGQVFFVVPRIEGIQAAADWLQELLPDIRIISAHGSISDLEKRIWAFAQREYDVLVCTTIIENGVNFPRVNTMIVQDAFRFGLAQLHQLRGRVGRCNIQAYAFMLFSRTSNIANVAQMRLTALERYSALGSGFVIAQRDLEMRGIGTVIGVEQHGSSGLDSQEYTKMLAEELAFVKTGQPIPLSLPEVQSSEVFLPVASYIPIEYISDLEEKMSAYGALSKAKTLLELNKVREMLVGKYGDFPAPALLHINVLKVKLLAKTLGISKVYAERQHVMLDWAVTRDALSHLVECIKDERVRTKFRLLEDDEKVEIRGLAVCAGDIQLLKMISYLTIFSHAASSLKLSEVSFSLEELLSK